MIRRRTMSSVAALVLVAVLSTLTALADASLPDPSWIGGLYDDNDFDDVVGFITSSASLIDEVATGKLGRSGASGSTSRIHPKASWRSSAAPQFVLALLQPPRPRRPLRTLRPRESAS